MPEAHRRGLSGIAEEVEPGRREADAASGAANEEVQHDPPAPSGDLKARIEVRRHRAGPYPFDVCEMPESWRDPPEPRLPDPGRPRQADCDWVGAVLRASRTPPACPR